LKEGMIITAYALILAILKVHLNNLNKVRYMISSGEYNSTISTILGQKLHCRNNTRTTSM